ncbi:AAA domain-containing protein [Leptolyngbya sp. NIES-2104]|uniref:AAA domain-containing protein n=1 Tax=Leptolyngbya sp. NIES-2104 TaxID=1552121 RepID=UPI0006ECA15A|nr:AAA domain-containing protein [Leptolyngbya sp. NIES-2104]GAP98057.1 DNA helicase related protein [Leptolyngbya sp. NIES-2104]
MVTVVNSSVLQQIEKWKEALSDTTLNNPLIRWLQSKGTKPHIQLSTPASLIYETLIHGEPPEFRLDELRTLQTRDEQAKSFNDLRLAAKKALEEKGVNTLFAVVGTIKWTTKATPKERDFTIAPLLLIPIELQKVRKRTELLQALDDDVLINPLIASKLDEDFRICLPDSRSIRDWDYGQFIAAVKPSLEQQANVRLEETAYIALFEDPKAALIRDLEECTEKIANHPILQALAGDSSEYTKTLRPPISPELIDQIHPNQVFQIRDADSSQQVVIETAKSGQSFVVKGPPGTGKSQTITNMVAELVGMKKRVLLVSEKQTALEVVAKRLAESGLSNLCLSFYDKGIAKKKGFLEELKRTENELQQGVEISALEVFFKSLETDRQLLTDHVQRLHWKQSSLNKSPFELFGTLLKFSREGVPNLGFHISEIRDWSEQRLADARTLLERLSGFSEIFLGEKATIWSEPDIQDWSVETSGVLRQELAKLRQAIQRADDIAIGVKGLLHLEILGSLRNLSQLRKTLVHLSDAPATVANWEITRDITELESAISQFEQDYHDLNQSSLWRVYDRQILQSIRSLEDLLNRFKNYQGWRRFFQRTYRDDRHAVTRFREGGCWVLDRTLVANLQDLAQLQHTQNRLRNPSYAAKVLLGKDYRLDDPRFDELRQGLDWLAELRRKSSVSITRVATLLRSPAYIQKIEALIQKIDSTVPQIEEGFDFIREHLLFDLVSTSTQELEEQSIQELRDLVERAQSDLDNLQEVIDCRNTEQRLTEIGLEDFLSSLRSRKLTASLWDLTLQQGIYQSWLRHLLDSDEALRMFRADTHEGRVQKFCKADERQFDHAQTRLKQLHAQQWRDWSSRADLKVQQQIQLFNAESGKARGPIRPFIANAPDLVMTLKPCWFMTPSAVSQFLDPEVIQFDTVIFDEASQIQIADAVPTIMRAKQVIIVGDREQLPPTKSQFTGILEEDDEEDNTYSSLLDACAFMESFSLKWHYRSQDESLIAFSEKNFYSADGLIYFPSSSTDEHRGVQFRFVENGTFDQKQGNPVEAREIAQMVQQEFPHLKRFDRSLGIITFGQSQEQAIRRELEKIWRSNPELETFCQEESNKFFVKPLEHVQGNEADVIFISFGYGRNVEGNLSRAFGLLNRQDTGRRRLNVAITRARYKLVLVASIHAIDLIQTNITNAELEILRRYFAYVESNGQHLEQQNYRASRALSLLEEDICYVLEKHNYVVEKQIGRSKFPINLAVKADRDSNNFLLGIECDEVNYSQYDTARDRDRLRRKVLEGLDWKIHRIWACEWYRDRDQQVRRLIQRIEALRKYGNS